MERRLYFCASRWGRPMSGKRTTVNEVRQQEIKSICKVILKETKREKLWMSSQKILGVRGW